MKQMINGWIIIDKPEGMSSAHVVAKVKRLFKVKKAGHGGTLDPMATGVLPIALGEATKALSYILDGTKAYRFEVKWGEARSTEDREGEITATSPHRPQRQDIEVALPFFTGTIEQTPPAYSALKVNGKRAYALARAGEDVVLAARKIEIYSLTLLHTSPDSASFEVVCSKGTYVRSLGRDIALHLGTHGHLISLRRTMAGPFHEKNAILLDSLEDIGPKKGRPEIVRAADAPIIAGISGAFSISWLKTVHTTWVSLRKLGIKRGLMGRSIRRETSVSCSLGFPSRLKKPPGMRPAAKAFS